MRAPTILVHRGILGRVEPDPTTGRPTGRLLLHGGAVAFDPAAPGGVAAAFRAAVNAHLGGLGRVRDTPASQLMDRYYDAIPQRFFELEDGHVLCGGTREGTRTLLAWLLELLGPGAAIERAPLDAWWQALRGAYGAPPVVDDWRAWAATVPAQPPPEPAGPYWPREAMQTLDHLRRGLWTATHGAGRRDQIGRMLWGFNVRIGDAGVMPDVLMLGPADIQRLKGYHVEGPPTMIAEIVVLGHEARDLEHKKRLYEANGVPEYWCVDPYRREVALWRLVGGRYAAQALAANGEYRTPALPGLVFAPARLWSALDGDDDGDGDVAALWRDAGDWPTLQDNDEPDEELLDEPIPPPPALGPSPVAYERFLRWQPEAKFEWLAGWPWIGGSRGTSELFWLLLLSEGLVETVRLLPAARWVTALETAAALGPLAPRLPVGELATALAPWLGQAAAAALAAEEQDDGREWFLDTEERRRGLRAEVAEARLRAAVAALRWLLPIDGDAETRAWFTAPCPELGGDAPIERLLAGDDTAVMLAARGRAWRLEP